MFPITKKVAFTFSFFFFNDTATTEIYTLSLHDALPISSTSFAEAFTETANGESIWDVEEKDIVNLADKAKESKSFAELISKQIKSDDMEE